VLGIDPFAKAKKPAAKRAPPKGKKKEESRKVVSYEQRKGATNLAEMCIKVSDLPLHVRVLLKPWYRR
jgi:DNA repair protein RAD7